MRICYLADVRLPTEKAHGLQIMKTCEALASAGAEVELAIPTRRTAITEDAFAYYGVKPVFTLTRLSVPDLIDWGQPGVLLSLLIFAERARFLKSFWRADVVYSRDHLVLLQYLLLGRPLVFEAHAPPSFLSRVVARRATRVVVISKALAGAYEAAGVPAARITLAPDAVDLEAFDITSSREDARKELGLPLDTKIVAYVGHLYERKGAEILAKAATHVPEALFVFVGGTQYEFKAFKKRFGGVANIRLEGYVPPSSVPLYLRAADLLVIPNSAKDPDASRYTSPMKLFEYMASGTPIITSDVPALREVLTQKEAYFFTPDNPAALAGAVSRTLADPARAAHAAAARTAVEVCTWQRRAEHILNALAPDTF